MRTVNLKLSILSVWPNDGDFDGYEGEGDSDGDDECDVFDLVVMV